MMRKISNHNLLMIVFIGLLTACRPSSVAKLTPISTPAGKTPPSTITQPIPTGTSKPVTNQAGFVTPAPEKKATTTPALVFGSPITLTGHTCSVTNLKWSPDGSLLASSCGFLSSTPQDDTVLLWRPDGTLASVLPGSNQPVLSLAWSPDGKLLAIGSSDSTIFLWNAAGQLVEQWQTNAGQVFALAWSPDGKILASGSIVMVTNPTVQLWDANGILLKTLSTSYSGGKFYNLAWSPDGKYLVGGATDYKLWKSDGALVHWRTACASCTPAWALAWSPDSQLWAIGNENGEIEVFDTSGKLVASMQDRTDVNNLAWSPDGSILAGAKALWRSDGTLLANLASPAQYVNSVAWSPDGSLLAAGDSDGLIRLFSPSGNPVGIVQAYTGAVQTLAWSPDGKPLATSGDDHTIKLWNVNQ